MMLVFRNIIYILILKRKINNIQKHMAGSFATEECFDLMYETSFSLNMQKRYTIPIITKYDLDRKIF